MRRRSNVSAVHRQRAFHQALHDLPGQEPRQFSGADELGHLLVDARLEPAARVLELRHVVVQDVEAARLVFCSSRIARI